MLTITVSGPASAYKKAQKVLKDAGFAIVLNEVGDPSSYDWGHDYGDSECFLTVEGESADRVVEVLEPVKWRLRSHRETPERLPTPSVEERLAAIGLTAADLRSVLGV